MLKGAGKRNNNRFLLDNPKKEPGMAYSHPGLCCSFDEITSAAEQLAL